MPQPFIRLLLLAAVLLIGTAAVPAPPVPQRFPGKEWDHVDPAQAGWSTNVLAQAHAWSDSIRVSAVMIVQHGAVVAEWGDTTKRMQLASVRKSLLDALIGVAVGRYQIDLNATLARLGINDNPPSLTVEEKRATVRELLEARSGVYHPALYETPGMAALRPPRGSHAPGTFWYYNNWDFNTLGAIYLHATGSSVFDAFEREIAAPIGMQDYRPSDGYYFVGRASVYPAYPIRMSARDLARFALLYLHEGRWRDRQVVPADWVRASTKPYSRSGFGPGYGYLWWTAPLNGGFAPIVNLPPGSYFAWGAGGQFAFVMPAIDLVVVSRVDRDIPGYRPTSLREVGRLLWLVLAADHQPDIGPDASLEAAQGTRLDDAAIIRTMSDATLHTGEAARGGPYLAHFAMAGALNLLKGDPPVQYGGGTWSADHNRLCDVIRLPRPEISHCFSVVADGKQVSLFDEDGLLHFAGTLTGGSP